MEKKDFYRIALLIAVAVGVLVYTVVELYKLFPKEVKKETNQVTEQPKTEAAPFMVETE